MRPAQIPDQILEISRQAHLWSPLILVVVVVLAALSTGRKLKYAIPVSLVAGLLIGLAGPMIEPADGIQWGSWASFAKPLLVCYWMTIGFSAVWLVVSQILAKWNARLFFTQVPLCFAGFLFLGLFIADRFVARPKLQADREFWNEVIEKQLVDHEMHVYKAHLSSAGREAVSEYLRNNDPTSMPVLQLLDSYGHDVSGEPNLDKALFRELKKRADRNLEIFPKGSAAANRLSLALAANPAMPPELLEECARSKELEVVAAVAANTNAPPQLLKELLENAKAHQAEEQKKPARERDGFATAQNRQIIERVERQIQARHLEAFFEPPKEAPPAEPLDMTPEELLSGKPIK